MCLGKFLWDTMLTDVKNKAVIKAQQAQEKTFQQVILEDKETQVLFDSVMGHCLQNLFDENENDVAKGNNYYFIYI